MCILLCTKGIKKLDMVLFSKNFHTYKNTFRGICPTIYSSIHSIIHSINSVSVVVIQWELE